MSNNIILELRQADSNRVRSNGDFETQLAKDITIEEGDIVQLKSCFIDTKRTSNNEILIEKDITVNFQNGIYINDWLGDTNRINYKTSGGQVGPAQSGKMFIPYRHIVITEPTDYYHITGVVYEMTPPDYYLTFGMIYSYVDLNNQTQYIHSTIPAFTPNMASYTDPISCIARFGSFKIITSPGNDGHVNAVGPIKVPYTIPLDVYEPYIFNGSIAIPAGSYSPLDLSLLISEKMSSSNFTNGVQAVMVQSPFLKYAGQFDVGQPQPDGSPGNIINANYFMANDLSISFQFQPSNAAFIGSSQMALEYNADTQKFYFDYLHMPMYDDSGQNISVRYMNNGQAGVPIIPVAKNGGVFFTSLTAEDIDGNYFDFWNGILGMNPALICAPISVSPIHEHFGMTGTFKQVRLQDGVNTTNGYYGLDSAVIKQPSKWYAMQLIPANTSICSTINNTVNIEAETPINELLTKYSHFILDINMRFASNVIGEDAYNNINGIISKFYAYNSYSYGSSDCAIQYMHHGNPIFLKSITCRVLQPDKTSDPELGPDNTIYIQIIKNNSNN